MTTTQDCDDVPPELTAEELAQAEYEARLAHAAGLLKQFEAHAEDLPLSPESRERVRRRIATARTVLSESIPAAAYELLLAYRAAVAGLGTNRKSGGA